MFFASNVMETAVNATMLPPPPFAAPVLAAPVLANPALAAPYYAGPVAPIYATAYVGAYAGATMAGAAQPVPLQYMPQQMAAPAVRPDNGLQVRCLQCKKFYLPSQNNAQACKHHNGKYGEPPAWQGGGAGGLGLGMMMKKWTCCGDIALSSEGCCGGWHQEDVATTHILDKFNYVANAPREVPNSASSNAAPASNRPTTSSNSAPGSLLDAWLTTGSAYSAVHNSSSSPSSSFINHNKQRELEDKEKKRSEEERELLEQGYFKHHVQTTDTLQGISLRYGIPVDDIKRVNKLFNASSLISRRFIYVKTSKDVTSLPPPIETSEEQRKRQMVSKFLNIGMDSSKEEARAYLESNNWDLTAALKEYDADRIWERNNGSMPRK